MKNAYNLLSTAYLSDGEEAEVYYTDFIKKNTTIGEGTHVASLKDGIDANKFYNNKKKDSTDDTTTKAVTNYNSTMTELNYNDKAEYTVKVDKEGLYYLNLDYISIGESLSDYTVKLAVNGKQQYSEMNTIALPIIWADEDQKSYVGSDKKKSFP